MPDREALEKRLEELKDKLYAFDRLWPAGRLGAEEKEQRRQIIRQISRLRRQLYRLVSEKGTRKIKVSLTLSLDEHKAVSAKAAAEGLTVEEYLRRLALGKL